MSRNNRNSRWRCPACGSKKVKALNSNKEMLILQCKRPSCETKWHIPKGTKLKMRLGDKDIKYEKQKEKMPKEIKEIIQAPPTDAQDLIDLGSVSLSKN